MQIISLENNKKNRLLVNQRQMIKSKNIYQYRIMFRPQSITLHRYILRLRTMHRNNLHRGQKGVHIAKDKKLEEDRFIDALRCIDKPTRLSMKLPRFQIEHDRELTVIECTNEHRCITERLLIGQITCLVTGREGDKMYLYIAVSAAFVLGVIVGDVIGRKRAYANFVQLQAYNENARQVMDKFSVYLKNLKGGEDEQ